MEEKKIKKKKLTLSVSSKKISNVSHYAQNRQKTSVVVEKKIPQRWNERKFRSQDSNINKLKSSLFNKPEPKLNDNLVSKKKVSSTL